MCNEYEWVGYLCICKCICKRHIHYTSNRIDRYEFVRLGPLCDMSHSYSLHTCYIREAHEYNMCAMNMGLCVICTATIFEYRISDRDVLAYPYLRILKHVV